MQSISSQKRAFIDVFGWLKRRLEKEHRKLAVQTFRASTDAEMPHTCIIRGHDAYAEYEDARNFSAFLIRKLAQKQELAPDEVEAAFRINKELRRLFDVYGRPGRGGFDQVYQPLGGWKLYFECNEQDIGEIERHEEVQKALHESLAPGKFPNL